jgi:sodium/potassium-transporting ATPase subunit alpha
MSRRDLSSVIRNFTLVSQQIELLDDKSRAAKIDKIRQKWARPEPPVSKKGKLKAEEGEQVKTDKIRNIDFHRLTWDEFQKRLKLTPETLKTGLSSSEALSRNEEFGDNALSEKKPDPWYVKIFHELTNFFSLLMWAGAAIAFLAYGLDTSDPSNIYLGAVLIAVIIITGLVTFFQNAKSDSIMEGFKNFIPQTCTVLRDNKETTILSAKVVPGDILLIKEGQRIPADIRIAQSNEMKVDNSSLTGESEALLRSEKCDQPDKILETKNVAFFGTLCKYGSGRGVVFNIADETVIGQIANLVGQAGQTKTPLAREIDRFITMITIIAITLGVVFFACGFILKYTAVQNLVFAIGIITANVPEGLLPTITIALAVAAKRLSVKQVLVKNLESVETLGSTSCICSDKTGTLTQNVMTVEHLWYNLKLIVAENKERKGPSHTYQYNQDDQHFQELAKCAVLNSAAVFSDSLPEKEVQRLENIKRLKPQAYPEELAKAEAEWKVKITTIPFFNREVIGDASETALIKFYQPIEDIRSTRNKYKIGKQFDGADSLIPFNSSYKFALKVFAIENDPEFSWVVYLKGAPERIWEKSSFTFANGKEVRIDDSIQAEFAKTNKICALNGERVLGFARLLLRKADYPSNYQFSLKNPHELPFKDFCFVGLISLIDPPKVTVPDAIEKCKSAGIKVIMVTGDQQLTAASIAKKIGIFDGKTSIDLAEEEGIAYDQAVDLCDAIVVNGDMLTQAAKDDEGLPEHEQGKLLEKWLKKSQIVFARTSPAQKLYIVKGCQKLGHIVAVTGDGVNDSPAIKQADIGISMGITGSDVAKDSADMILLNDDFSSIVTGIEEGRRIFDNLKKTIGYMLASNIPEMMAFLIFIIFAVPLPLSTILILCISVGTDIFPAIGIGFEDAELDVMTRLPRSPIDHLVSKKLLVYAYLQIGIIESAAGFISYFLVLNDFGFPPGSLSRLVTKPYFPHNPSDRYNPSAPFFGNTNVSCNSDGKLISLDTLSTRSDVETSDSLGKTIDWLFTKDILQDTRMGYLSNSCSTGISANSIVFGECKVFQISPISKRPVCYTTEALKYAQTAYFFSIVFAQFFNTICAKTRKLSFSSQSLANEMMILGWVIELVLTFLLAYLRPVNIALGSRDVKFLHYGLYGLFFAMMMLVYDETRKFLIRNFPRFNNKPNWFERNSLI